MWLIGDWVIRINGLGVGYYTTLNFLQTYKRHNIEQPGYENSCAQHEVIDSNGFSFNQ